MSAAARRGVASALWSARRGHPSVPQCGAARRSHPRLACSPLTAAAPCLPPWPPQVPPDATPDQIRTIFQEYGSIDDLNIMAPRKPGSMGAAAGKKGATPGPVAFRDAALR
jgi:hypothetical protein